MIKQTLKYSVSTSNRTRYGEWEGVTISNMSLTMDTGEDYAKSLTSEIMVNHANNADMDISLPIADIPTRQGFFQSFENIMLINKLLE
jgi:hypothetical protein